MSMYGQLELRLDVSGESRTKQSMKKECDVNRIVSSFQKTGLIDHLADGIPVFADVSELGDYRSVIEQVRAVDAYFAGLPAKVRTAFSNDASNFMDYLESGATAEELERAGLEVLDGRLIELVAEPPAEIVVPPLAEIEPPEEAGTVST